MASLQSKSSASAPSTARGKSLDSLPYRFRYMNGQVSAGGFKTFEAAVKSFMDAKHSGKYGSLYNDLKDVVCIERSKDYLL